MRLKQAARYWHSVRHMSTAQILARLYFKALTPKPELSPTDTAISYHGPWEMPAIRPAELTPPNHLTVLNRRETIPTGRVWEIEDASPLWNYHLHYFDDLVAEGFAARRKYQQSLIRHWIEDNPPATGTGWHPYPISRRICNWIKAELSDPLLDADATHSLAIQTRYLRKRIEHLLRANHLWLNAKALIFAGLFFGAHKRAGEARGWYETGMRILRKELEEQIKADGSHFEQSPVYATLIFEDLLDLINLHRAYEVGLSTRFAEHAARMRHYLDIATLPNERWLPWNDSSQNLAVAKTPLFSYADRLGIRAVEHDERGNGWTHFLDAGLVYMHKDGWQLWLDTGPVGCSYTPGHVHADSLNVELWRHGRAFFIEAGTGDYWDHEARTYQRSSKAHNAITIDGENSSDVWSVFRCAQQAIPCGHAQIHEAEGQIECRAGYEGFATLRPPVRHWRTIEMQADQITFTDRLEGKGTHQISLSWHLAPGLQLHPHGEGYQLVDEQGDVLGTLQLPDLSDLHLEPDTQHIGVGESNKHLRVTISGECQLPTTLKTTLACQ